MVNSFKNNRFLNLLAPPIILVMFYYFTNLLLYIGYMVLPKYFTITSEIVNYYITGVEVVISIILLAVLYLAFKKFGGYKDNIDELSGSKLKGFEGAKVVKSVVLGVGLVGSSFLIMKLAILTGIIKPSISVSAPFLETFIITVLFAPLIEELLFRGIIHRLLDRFKPGVFAICMSSLLFAVYHMDLVQGVITFVMGVVTAFVYDKTKSIKYPIMIHAVNNFMVLLTNATGLSALKMPINYIGVVAILPAVYFLVISIKKNGGKGSFDNDYQL